MRWWLVGASSTGSETCWPSTLVAGSRVATSASTRGRSLIRRKASQFSATPYSSSAPLTKYSHASGVTRSNASASKSNRLIGFIAPQITRLRSRLFFACGSKVLPMYVSFVLALYEHKNNDKRKKSTAVSLTLFFKCNLDFVQHHIALRQPRAPDWVILLGAQAV